MKLNTIIKGLYNEKYPFEGELLSYRHHTTISGLSCQVKLTKPCKRPGNAFYAINDVIIVHLPYCEKSETA